MCGIFFSCYQSDQDCTSNQTKLIDFLKRRGPDSLEKFSFLNGGYQFNFIGSVLHIRGNVIIKQPLVQNKTDIFLWNGENYNCGSGCQDESDTLAIFNELKLNCNQSQSIYPVLSSIRGPFAFVYWNEELQTLWFGRDILGRRSLCRKKSAHLFQLSLCSICDPNDPDWEEVSTEGIFRLKFSQENGNPQLDIIKWSHNTCGDYLNPTSPLQSLINHSFQNLCPPEIPEIINQEDEAVSCFIDILGKSVETRISKFNQLCQNCYRLAEPMCNHSSVAVLFSGGLDSTVLALLCDKYVPSHQSIDLLNVAFSVNAPDRMTGHQAYSDLVSLAPTRRWNFVTIDVSRDELQSQRDEHIKYLIKPLNTILDDSIACALWFASKGLGQLESHSQPYHSPARVIMSGLGADEQLAGYSRHRKVFQEKGWQGLINEVCMEISRIPSRNLGRDDRILCDHGREPRYPYLDEDVISFLNSLPIWKKVNLTLERGKGEKLLLRLVAHKLGLARVSGFWKRAIQFGSRIAHLEGKGEKGQNQCLRLET